jgi:hypothetical protein
MGKKSFLLALLFVFIFLASGCVSITAEKVYVDGKPAGAKPAKASGEEDPGIIKKTDDWVKKNLW